MHYQYRKPPVAVAAALLIATLLLVGGCARTTQPILLDEQVISDSAIVGKWTVKDNSETVEIRPGEKDKTYRVMYTDKDSKKGIFVGRLGRIGAMQIAELSPEDPMPGANDAFKAHLLKLYSFFLVEQTNPELIIRAMSAEWVQKYVDAHPGELHIAKTSNDDAVVTSSTAEIQAFLLRHAKDEGAFGEPSVMTRAVEAAAPATAK